jgi:hypothetical protein
VSRCGRPKWAASALAIVPLPEAVGPSTAMIMPASPRSRNALASPQIAIAAQNPSSTSEARLVLTSSETSAVPHRPGWCRAGEGIGRLCMGGIGIGEDDAGHAGEAELAFATVSFIPSGPPSRASNWGKLVAIGRVSSTSTPARLARPATAMLIAMRWSRWVAIGWPCRGGDPRRCLRWSGRPRVPRPARRQRRAPGP